MPLEARLSAFMDGETSREEKEELERLIASDPEARRIFDELRHGSDVGRKAFEEVLKEPVPLALVRSIKSAQAPKAREPAPRLARPSLKLAPTGRQALAAALILFLVGGGIGYLLGILPTRAPPLPRSRPRRTAHGWTILPPTTASIRASRIMSSKCRRPRQTKSANGSRVRSA